MEQNSISVRFNPNKRNDILAVNNTQNLLIGLISSMKTGLFVDSLENMKDSIDYWQKRHS